MNKSFAHKGKVAVIGCGPGHPDYLTPAAEKAALDCGILFGAPRFLDLFPDFSGEKRRISGDMEVLLRDISELSERKRVGVLVSGDPGCFSLAENLKKRLGRDRCLIIPGIGSVQLAVSRLGLSWVDTGVFSIHGRKPPAAEKILGFDTAVILFGRDLTGLDSIWEKIAPAFTCFFCRDLGLPGEQIWQATSLAELKGADPANALLVLERKT